MTGNAEVVIASACRTAIGDLDGSLAGLTAVDLGRAVIAEAVARAGLAPSDVEEVLMGNVLGAGLGPCPSRQAALAAGVPDSATALDVGMVCASGLRAVALGAQAILRGERALVVAGGMESMSQAPHLVRGLRRAKRMGPYELEDAVLVDGLTCPVGHEHMAMTAERLAGEFGISRAEQDAFAFESHTKAAAARKAFAREIVPVAVPGPKGAPRECKVDEHVRPDTTVEKLSKLPPVFRKGGTITAGNASGVNDGAAALVLASARAVREKGLKSIAKVVGWASAGVAPGRMGIGPVPATRRLCGETGLALEDFDLVELNEAFAAQSLAVIRELGLDPKRVNVRGGAVALGHPLGCSGARLLVTLLHAMEDLGARRGLATLCVGTGMGMSLAVEAPRP